MTNIRNNVILLTVICFVLVAVVVRERVMVERNDGNPSKNAGARDTKTMPPYLVVLGIAQDAGYPQAGCQRACCASAWKDHRKRRYPCCVAVVDSKSQQRWMFDCTPNFPDQLRDLDQLAPATKRRTLDGIFLTHAHIGHYTGLIHVGREVMGTNETAVFAMPKMMTFLKSNGPWSLLVDLKNIVLRPLEDKQPVSLTESIHTTPLTVPHRGEYSETIGFLIEGPSRSVLYLPDIDRWEDWNSSIEQVVRKVDRAYVDGTFFSGDELPGRDMSKIPHPTIKHSIQRFSTLPQSERNKIHFLHLNHTNPALQKNSDAYRQIIDAGHHVARQGEVYQL